MDDFAREVTIVVHGDLTSGPVSDVRRRYGNKRARAEASTASGRQHVQVVDHRDWCEMVFAHVLTGRTGAERRLARIVAVCDVHMWKLLRRDAGLSRDQTELSLVELLTPILKRH